MSHRYVACCAWVGVLSATATASYATEVSFTQVAREFQSNVGFLNVSVPAALSDDGKVVFAAESPPFSGTDTLFAWDAGAITPIPLGGRDVVSSVAVNSAGHVAFVSRRPAGSDTYYGVYRTSTTAAPIVTLREELQDDGVPSPRPRYLTLSENGTLAYSTIVSATGAIYRGPVTGTQSVLRSGSGVFFNTQRLDVNDAGRVAVQMEHVRPFGGLGRGILLFDSPEQPLTSIDTAIEQLGVGTQPMPSMNNAGQVAFALNTTVNLTFYDPPNDFGGTVIDTVTLTPGVYVTTPETYGVPRSFTQVADTDGDFASFDRVLINDAGLVVFEAGLDGGGGGIFTGGDPVADKVIALGEFIGATRMSFYELGELNNANQFTLITSDFISTDRQVWLVTVPEPATAASLCVASLALLARRRRRTRV